MTSSPTGERRPCIQCERAIDVWAKICPFCNWDQETPVPAVRPAPPRQVTEYRPPEELGVKKKLMTAGIGILLLLASFGVGVIINSDGAPKSAPETVEEQQLEEGQKAEAKPAGLKRANTPLVPTDEPGGIEQPITSAPIPASEAGAAPDDYQRTDATAVSATEYAEIAKRAKAEKETMSAIVDPRSLTGASYEQAPQPRRRLAPARPVTPPAGGETAADAPAQPVRNAGRNSIRTRPVPEYQPLPRLASGGTARLTLIIGVDGRVSDVNVQRPLPGGRTPELIAAVQRWRFKPATENGEPVAAPYSVDISFDR